MSDLIYRDATLADADALAAIGRATFVQTFGAGYRAEDLNAFLDRDHTTVAALKYLGTPDTHVRFVEEEGAVAGYAMLAPSGLPFAEEGRRAIEVKRFYLLRPLHGRGVADALMQWALARAAALEYDDVVLSVFSDNERAKRFYARYGFEEVGAYVFMVGEQADDERVWRKRLR